MAEMDQLRTEKFELYIPRYRGERQEIEEASELIDILKAEQQYFDQPFRKKLDHLHREIFWFGVASFLFVLIGIPFLILGVDSSVSLVQNEDVLIGYQVTKVLGISEEVHPLFLPLITLTIGLSLLFMEIFVFYILIKRSKLQPYDSQLLTMLIKFNEMNTLEEYIEVDQEDRRFRLVKIPISRDLEWLFPFLFETLPPLVTEALLVILFIMIDLVFFSLAFFTENPDIRMLMGLVTAAFTGLLLFLLHEVLYKPLRNYQQIQREMINKEQENIFSLITEKKDPALVIMRQNNLIHLKSMPLIPLSIIFQIIPFIPIILNLLGIFWRFMGID